MRSHTFRVATVPVHVWTLLVAEALYGTRLQVARVSFKPAFVDKETCASTARFQTARFQTATLLLSVPNVFAQPVSIGKGSRGNN